MERKLVILKEDLLNRRDKNKLLESDGNYLESQVNYVIDISINSIKLVDTKIKEAKEYLCEDINCINLSMCSRYAGGTGRNGGIRTTINIDVDVVLNDETLLFEIMDPHSFQKVIDFCDNNNIEIIDMIGVVDIYKQYPNQEKREKYLEINFNKLSKKYRLDHPRFKSRFK